MSSTFRYIKMQLKEKVVSNPKMTLLSFISPVLFFLFYFVFGKIISNGKENDQRLTTNQCVFFTTTMFFSYIILDFNAAYDLIVEKKKYRKQHMYTHGFGIIKFHICWSIIYALLILPTSMIIVALVYFVNMFPGINVMIFFLTFYFYQVSIITLSFWLSSYFSNPNHGGIFTVIIQIIHIMTYFCKSYGGKYDDRLYIQIEYSPTDKIIWMFRDIVNKNEYVGFTNLFTRKYMWIYINLSSIFASILLFILFAVLSDIYFISKHVRRNYSERKSKEYYKGLVINGPNTRVRQVPCYEDDQGFFDWNEMRRLFKVNKEKYRTVYEEINDNIQQDYNRSGKEIISVNNIFKKYDNNDDLSINNISFKVYTNEILIITDTSDFGDSSILMKMLYGRESSSYGSIIIKGKEMNGSKWKSICQDISVVPKEDCVFMEHLSVSDNIKFYAGMCSTKEKGISILNELNFHGNSSDLIKNLDIVEKTKIKIALTLLKSKTCIFIEEPTALMSEKDSACFWNIIKSRKNKNSIIISTSSIKEALTHGDRVVVLKDGKTHCIGDREFVKKHLSINENEPELKIKINNFNNKY